MISYKNFLQIFINIKVIIVKILKSIEPTEKLKTTILQKLNFLHLYHYK